VSVAACALRGDGTIVRAIAAFAWRFSVSMCIREKRGKGVDVQQYQYDMVDMCGVI
jgi:guanylate kinase